MSGVCGNIVNGNDPDNECTAQAASTCGTDGSCNGTGACRLFPTGTVCTASSCAGSTFQPADTCNGSGTCTDNGSSSCTPYVCGTSSCKTSCATSSDCVTGYVCQFSQCVVGSKPNGSPCSTAAECASTFCVNGFCCNSACTGTCKSCDGQYTFGIDGFCEDIQCADPYGECMGSDVCNGVGHCGQFCA
jgi:hypothetical protein